MTRPPTVRTCKYCCSGCGCHFVSLQAFDAHRGGSFREGTRHCWPEDAENRLSIVREDGACLMDADNPKIGVRLWRHDPEWRSPESVHGAIRASEAADGVRAA